MANGGGSRAGGFLRGVLVGLLVCAIVAVVLSLWAPLPESVAPVAVSPVEPVAPGGAAMDGADPAEPGTGAGTPPAADVTVIPAEPAAEPAEPAADPAGTGAGEEAVAPQPTWPQAGSATGDGATDTGNNFSDEPNAGGQAPTQ